MSGELMKSLLYKMNSNHILLKAYSRVIPFLEIPKYEKNVKLNIMWVFRSECHDLIINNRVKSFIVIA
jgi:hypothetical protein